MIEYADLHLHTNYSDSTLTPSQVVFQAKQFQIGCIAITDHDTVDGMEEAVAAGQAHGVEIIPGIELSCEAGNREIHILGFFFDYQHPDFHQHLLRMQDSRVARMGRMLEKLNGIKAGGDISLEEVCARGGTTAVGRMHLAMIMKEKGLVKNVQTAFDRYLAEGGPAYVAKYRQTPAQAIALIKKFGGVAVLAHPMLTRVDEMIPAMVRDGLGGLEVYYPNVSSTIIEYYEGIGRKHNLLLTGGSDAHGAGKDNTAIGKIRLPYRFVEAMKQTLEA
ncbi:MAG: PHP domain-containing protein [Candidatus Omnitrophica bacterium]|nr:PHP domain-containing protein [Candidatus Omnitrophota bacterium]